MLLVGAGAVAECRTYVTKTIGIGKCKGRESIEFIR